MNRSLAQLLAAPTAAGMLFLLPAGIAQAEDQNSREWLAPGLGSLGGSLVGVALVYFLYLKEIKSKVGNIKEDVTRLSDKIISDLKTDLKDEMRSLNTATQEGKIDLENKIKDINDAIEKIQQFFPEINEAYKQFDSKIIAELNLLVVTIKKDLIEIDSKFSDFKADNLNTSQEIENQIAKLKSITQGMSNDQMPELRKAIQGIEINVKGIETDINSIKSRLHTLDA